jgi:hypothetical protein
MTELLVVSLAAAIGWNIVRNFYPWNINPRIAPIVVVLISFLFTFAYTPSAVVAFAAAGGVAVFHKVTDATSLDPVSIRLPSIPGRIPRRDNGMKIIEKTSSSQSHRIPAL